MAKQKFIFLFFYFFLHSVTAFGCDGLDGGDAYICESISKANLSNVEKDMLISDIFNQNKSTPNFDFVYLWNTNLDIKNSPDGKEYSSGIINHAWVKIISLMPSIIEDGTLYSSNNGKILVAYNYGYTLPSGKYRNDCKTKYFLDSKSEDLKIFLNDNLIGNEKLSSFIISNSSDNLHFVAEVTVHVNYRIVHYREQDSDHDYGCLYYSTEYSNSEIKLSDSLDSKFYKSQLSSDLKIINKYNGMTRGNLTAYNFTKLILSFNNSVYQIKKYIYLLNYSLPYYVLTLRAEEVEDINFNNLYVDKINDSIVFTVKDSSNCKVELFDHFSSISKNCNMSFDPMNFSVNTDKTNYYDNDTIKVYISPSNLSLNLSYANQSKLVRNYTEFKAVLYQNRIIIRLDDQESNIIINVNKKEDWIILYNIALLFLVVYLIFKLTKFYFSRCLK